MVFDTEILKLAQSLVDTYYILYVNVFDTQFFLICLLVVFSGVQGGFCLAAFWEFFWQKKPAWVNLQHSCLNDIDVQRDVHTCSCIIVVVSFIGMPSITDSSAFKGTWSGGT